MSVTREQIEGALQMTLDDEAIEDNNVKQYEIHAIKRRFNTLMDTLYNDADIEDEDDDTEGEAEDTTDNEEDSVDD